MKIRRFDIVDGQKGFVKNIDGIIEVRKGCYDLNNKTTWYLKSGKENQFVREYRFKSLEKDAKYFYSFPFFGRKVSPDDVLVGMTWLEHQKFLWIQDEHWLKKENNIRYIVNVLFLVLGAIVAVKGLIK
jgi:hypothetical protein